jgi:steroid 5-alpha reductase family enzyme
MTTVMLASAAAVLALLLGAWVLSLVLRDVSIVDVAWGLGFVAVAWVAFAVGDGCTGRRVLLAVLTTLWGLRLAGYIGRRKLRHPGEDPRYGAWREKWGERFPLVSLFTVFGLQAVLVWVVSLPLQGAATSDDPLGVLDWVGVAVWAIGLACEATGDAQMARFKADPANKGRIMDRGLWRYTRHPNYFGDAAVWAGLFLVAADSWPGVLTVLSPAVMIWTLAGKTGKPLTEKAMSARPGYQEYIDATSGFLPLPPRHGRARRR